MGITEDDISLSNFLKKVTYTGDPLAGTKMVVDIATFLNTASLLKLASALESLRQKIT